MTTINQNNSFIISGDNVTVVIDNKVFNVDPSHTNYTKIVEALKQRDYTTVSDLIDLEKAVRDYSNGAVEVKHGVVYYNGRVMDNSLTERMLRMLKEGFDVGPLCRFMERLMKNPSGRAVKELYRFLESNSLPLSDDGYFLAYKNVREDFKDKHSGTFDNSVGSVCEMPRNEVMDDPNQTCSAGLHFCSIEYLKGFWGTSGHTMIVKIDPADVVSIPVDYNNSKGRCCKYTVIAEHFNGTEDTLSEKSVYGYQEEESYDRQDALDVAYEVGYDAAYEGHGYGNPYDDETDLDLFEQYDAGFSDGNWDD